MATTRARHTLVIIGNLAWLAHCDDNWRSLIAHARADAAPKVAYVANAATLEPAPNTTPVHVRASGCLGWTLMTSDDF